MSSVDSRIVTAKFDNAQFERGAAQTMSTLDKLKQMLNFDHAGKGLTDVQNAANRFHLNPMHSAIEGVSKAWLGMAAVAATAISRVTNFAINEGKKLASGFLGPIKDGFNEYETTLNSVQTILANTGLRGEKGLHKVNRALDQLNTFSDKTIYNFTQMASNVGTFTAAGIKLKPAVSAIKGIADLAALSGSNAQQAATGMYQLSQAISTGVVRLQDWNSVSNAGFGGKVFQESLKRVARAHGVAVDEIIKKNGSFRASLQENWLSSDILTESLQQFTGDLTDAQLRSMGYSDKQVTKIQRLAKTAIDAATKVKTMSQLMGTLKEAAGSGWAKTWQTLLGDFGEAKTLFTNVNDVLGGFIQRSAEARNKVLGDWKALGGRTLLIDSIKNAFNALMDVLTPIKEAFREIFPPKTGQDLYNLTVALHNFTEGLKVSEGTQKALKSTFAGLFAILDIGWTIVKNIFQSFLSLFGLFKGDGQGSILEFTGGIGDALVALDEWLKQGDKIGAFFGKFQAAFLFLSPITGLFIRLATAVGAFMSGGFDAFLDELAVQFSGVRSIVALVGKEFETVGAVIGGFLSGLGLGGIFDGFSTGADKAADGLGKVNDAFETTADVGGRVKDGLVGIGHVFAVIGGFLAGFAGGIANAFGLVKEKLGEFFQGLGIEDTLAVIDTGFFIALYISFRKFLGRMGQVAKSLSGTFDATKNVLNQVTSNLKSMQTEVRAKAILEIAAALAILAAALWVLSRIDPKALGASLIAVVTLLGALSTAIVILEKKTKDFGGAARVTVLAGGMLLLGVAMLAMAGAVKILAKLDTKELVKGVSAIGFVLAAVVGGAAILEKAGGAQQMVVASAAILILAAALTAFAGALKLYASIDTATLAEGGAKAAAALAAISLTMRAMPKNMVGSAAALFIVANALVVLAGALRIMGGMSTEEIAKSLITLGGAMLIIAVGLNAMEFAVAGAGAMLLFAAALAVLVPSLIILGHLDVKTIALALGVLAAVFVVLAAGAFLLEPVVPILLALAGAIALLGAGIALIGGGIFLFALGLATLAASGAAGIAVLTASIIAVAELFPLLMHQFGLGVRALAVVIAQSGPQLVAAFSTVLGSLIKAVIINTPKLARMLMIMIREGLRVLVDAVPRMVVAGIQIILGIMQGIRDNIGRFVHTASEIMQAWLRALGKEIPKLADAALKFVIALVNGIADAIDQNTAALLASGVNLATALIQGIVNGLKDSVALGKVVDAAKALAKSALDAAKHFLGVASPSKEFMKLGKYVDQGFALGIVGGLDDVKDAMDKMKDLISSAVDVTKAEIDDQKQAIEDLKKKPVKNADDIVKATKKLEALEAQLKKATDARKIYNKDLKDERDQLIGLGKQYDSYTKQIDDAKDALKQATDARDEFQKSTASSFGSLPDIAEATDDKAGTSVAEYEAALKTQTDAVTKFKNSLDVLKTMGLDDATYKKFLDEGIGIQPFIDELIAGGPAAVDQIDTLTDALGVAAGNLGTTASLELYQAGVDSAQGLLNGLVSKRQDIADEMTHLGKLIAKTIRKALKMHSPSKVMEEIGKFTNEGLANGLDKHAGMVTRSATNVADAAIESIKSTLQGVSAAVMTDVNASPTITPVLDLTQVSKDAAQLNSLMDKSLIAQVSSSQAASISNEQAAKLAAKIEAADVPAVPQTVVNLEQNNHSPEPLNPVTVYRDTKNLLSLAKEALKQP
jgi:tape measure domain-containing protein